MPYLRNLYAALIRDGADLDITENACLDGLPGMTISMRCALADRAGKLWARIACAALWFVQVRHCQCQIAGVPMNACNYARAIIALIGVPALLILAVDYGAHLVLRLI